MRRTIGEDRDAIDRAKKENRMEATEIFGVDIHDAVMDLKRSIEDQKFIIHSPTTIRALARIQLGPDGRVDPTTVGSEVRATLRAYIAGKQTRELEAQKAKAKEERIGDLFES
jgi:hypothetical protein